MRGWRAPLLALLLEALVVGPSGAGTKHFSSVSGGSGASAWTDSQNPATPCALFVAITNAAAGDTVQLLDGGYSTALVPSKNGTAASPIVFLGNPVDTAAVQVPSITFGGGSSGTRGDYCIVKYVKSLGALSAPTYLRTGSTWGGAIGSQFIKCCGVGSLVLNGWYCKAESCSVVGMTGNHALEIQGFESCGTPCGSGRREFSWLARQNEIAYCRLVWRHTAIEQTIFCKPWGADSTWIHHSDLDLTDAQASAANQYLFAFESYAADVLILEDNDIRVHWNTLANGTKAVISFRDHSSWNGIRRNRITVDGTGSAAAVIWVSNSGSYGASCRGTTIEGNTIRSSITLTEGAISAQNGYRGCTIQFNDVFATNGRAIGGLGAVDTTFIRHNTFVSSGAQVVGLPQSNFSTANASRYVSNIAYSAAGNSSGVAGASVVLQAGIGADSLGLVFARSGTAANGIFVNGVGTGAPGSGGSFGQATKALWNTPRFLDSLYATFNGTPLTGSPAYTATLQDGFAGKYGTAAVDTCVDAAHPARVLGFVARAGGGQILVSGTAPGQSQYAGDPALVRMEFRRSSSPINEANWNAATLIDNPTVDDLGGLPGDPFTDYPLAPLPAKGLWYIGARGVNVAATPDTFGCVASDTLNSPDNIRPARVLDLVAQAIAPDQVQVSFTAVGDDSLTGTATSWQLRSSGNPIVTEGNWQTANQVTTNFAPGAPGVLQTFVNGSRTPGSTTWYAVRFNDAALNQGAISNSDSASTPTVTAPATRPAPITNLFAGSPGNGLVTLTWTAPGNDSLTGTAIRYEIRFKRFTVLGSTLLDDTLRTGSGVYGQTYFLRGALGDPPQPQPAGNAQSLTFAFDPDVDSWWAIRTLGTSGVWSAWSNIDSTRTRHDNAGTDSPAGSRVCYCGAQPTPAGYFVGSPFIKPDSLTVDTTHTDATAVVNSVISWNPRMATLPALKGVARYLDDNHPTRDRALEFTIDPAYMPVASDLTRIDAKYDWRFNYNARMWRAITSVTAYPTGFAFPYTGNFGTPAGYNTSSDTTSVNGFLWSNVLGRKNLLHGSGTGTWTGSAGLTQNCINWPLKINGVYVLAESSAVIEADILNNLRFQAADGSMKHVVTARLTDLNGWYSGLDNTPFGDIVDHVRAGYASRAAFDSAYTEAKMYRERRIRELCPWLNWSYANGDYQLGYPYTNGSSREGFPLFGAGWQAEAWRLRGGAMADLMLFRGRPRRGQLFDFPNSGTQGDSMSNAWILDDSAVQQEIRFSGGTAALFGLMHTYSNPKAAAASAGWMGNPYGWYGEWVFPHQFVNPVTAAIAKPGTPGTSTYLGARVGFPYAHLPSSTGAVWSEDFTNGANPDSSQLGALTKNADGRVTIRPGGPPGLNYHAELRTVRQHGQNFDYLLALDAIGSTSSYIPTVAGQDLTVSGWCKADSSRWFGAFLFDTTGVAWGSTLLSGQRLWATPTWQPFSYTVTAGATSRRVRPFFTVGDTTGVLRLAGLQVHRGDSTLWMQEFQNGVVMVNPSVNSIGHTFGRLTRAIDDAMGTVNKGQLSRSVVLSPSDGRFLMFAADSVRPAQPNAPAAYRVRCSSTQLALTGAADDSLTGLPATVEVRVSPSAITQGNFASATLKWLGAPVGVLGDLSVSLVGLTPNTTYHVAYRAIDEAGFVGLVSPEATFTTPASCQLIARFEGK